MAEFSGTLTVRDEQSGLSFEVPLESVDIRYRQEPMSECCEEDAFTVPAFTQATINVNALVTDLRERICAALGVPAAIIAPKPGVNLAALEYCWQRLACADEIYRATPVSRWPEFEECETCRAKPGSPVLCNDCLERRAACTVAINLLPVALTQAELEVLKPGPRPTEYGEGICTSCLDCRLTPPKGYRNDAGTLFLCKTCYEKKVKK